MWAMRSRKAYVMAAGALGLAGALTAAALVAPERAAAAARTYVPADAATIVAHVPARDSRELEERRALAAAPESLEVAVALAQTELGRARTESDPRYLGRAQALLGRWWKEASPPVEVLLLRATINQSLHQFAAARADLDQLVAARPNDVQAHLTRAVVATVTADYAAARESCAVLETVAAPVIAAACHAPLIALGGDIDGAYRGLAQTIDTRTPAHLRAWALTTLAELAIQRGDDDVAQEHLRAVLALDPNDAYALAALADLMPPTEVVPLLAGFDAIDNLLVRRAIAAHRARSPEAAALATAMRERISAAATRGDSIHQREEAMFALAIDGDAPRALRLARANWDVQKELADARLLVEAAIAARDHAAAAPVLSWMEATGVRDTRLHRLTRTLTGGSL